MRDSETGVMAPAATVSVIVPCRNAGSHLRRSLQSLVNQEIGERAEVIVVDNGSTDGSRQVAATVAGRLPIRIVDAPERANASYARNVGAAATSSDKLIFVDADDEVAPGYLAAMASALDSHDFVTSRVDSTTLNARWVKDAHGPSWQDEGVSTFLGFRPAAGPNTGIQRALFERVGGFPEDLPASEDIAFSWQVQSGSSIHFVPDAVYRYRYRDTLGGLYRQAVDWGSSTVLLYRRFRATGMPGRTLQQALIEWIDVLRGFLGARNKADLAPLVVRLGYCIGRMIGSVRYRVLYP